jgi:hypothetical protein
MPLAAHATARLASSESYLAWDAEPDMQHHDWLTATLTAGLCVGLVISYLPQHVRIISKGTSDGLSPWFLLLGSTSSAAGFLNMCVGREPDFP